jgi:hypothetical protein
MPPDLVRLSCGVEDPADLAADLRDALAALPVPAWVPSTPEPPAASGVQTTVVAGY